MQSFVSLNYDRNEFVFDLLVNIDLFFKYTSQLLIQIFTFQRICDAIHKYIFRYK